MRIVYLGSPQMAVPPLRALVEAGHEVVLAVTNPPSRRGRRSGPQPTAVGAAAAELGIPVKLVGLGETADDLVDFEPDEFVDALFDA